MAALDFYATQPHYIDHLAPIWHARRYGEHDGAFIVPVESVRQYALGLGIPAVDGNGRGDNPVLVASGADLQQMNASRPIALMEHGCGQTYNGSYNISYAGGDGRESVDLFLCPNLRTVQANANHREQETVLVGTPYLDEWVRTREICAEKRKQSVPLVVISFHWAARASIESGTAFPEWRHQLPDLKRACDERGWKLRGHAHPRILDNLRLAYHDAGIPVIERFDEVLEKASLYIIDNSSTLYEFAGAGAGATIALRSSKWRRDVHHGLRFWDAVPGPDLSPGDKIEKWLDVVMADNPSLKEKRVNALEVAYSGTLDGESTERAAAALERWVDKERWRNE